MTISPEAEALQRALKAEIAKADLKISQLQRERATLHNLLLNALAGRTKPLRRDSVAKISTENVIMAFLTAQRKPVTAKAIASAVLREMPGMSGSTIRSHIRRLHLQGVLRSDRRGLWELVSVFE